MQYPEKLSFKDSSRIILIGTTTSIDPVNLPPIPHAERNIDNLSRIFKDPDICGLEDDCVVRMLDRENASEVTSDLARIAKEATDTLLVYYVGHGLYGDADNPLYLATTKTTEEGKAFNGISIELVKKAMRSSVARKRILILDCCYSGRAMEGGMSSPSPLGAAEPAIDVQGTYGIAAVPATAKALAPPDEKLTRFTGALVDVLDRGLLNNSNVLTLENVFEEVDRRVREKGDAPPPKRINWDGGSNFCIAFNRALATPTLGELHAAVNGLRETSKTMGVKLEALEAKVVKMDDLLVRLEALETRETTAGKSPAPIASLSSSQNTELWEYAGLSESEWMSLPVDPFRIHIKDCRNGRRYGLFFTAGNLYLSVMLTGLAISFSSSSISPLQNRLQLIRVLLTFLYGCFGFVLMFLLISRNRSKVAYSPEYYSLLSANEKLFEIMRTRIIHVFGMPIQSHFGWISVVAIFLALAVSILIPLLPDPPRY